MINKKEMSLLSLPFGTRQSGYLYRFNIDDQEVDLVFPDRILYNVNNQYILDDKRKFWIYMGQGGSSDRFSWYNQKLGDIKPAAIFGIRTAPIFVCIVDQFGYLWLYNPHRPREDLEKLSEKRFKPIVPQGGSPTGFFLFDLENKVWKLTLVEKESHNPAGEYFLREEALNVNFKLLVKTSIRNFYGVGGIVGIDNSNNVWMYDRNGLKLIMKLDINDKIKSISGTETHFYLLTVKGEYYRSDYGAKLYLVDTGIRDHIPGVSVTKSLTMKFSGGDDDEKYILNVKKFGKLVKLYQLITTEYTYDDENYYRLGIFSKRLEKRILFKDLRDDGK